MWFQRSVVRIAKYLGNRLSPKPVSLIQPSRDIGTDTADVGESEADSTSGDDCLARSAPF